MELNFPTKKIGYLFLLLIIIATGVLIAIVRHPTTEIATAHYETKATKTILTQTQKNTSVSGLSVSTDLSPEFVSDRKESVYWDRETGTYSNYTEDQLKLLAEQKDVNAMVELAFRKIMYFPKAPSKALDPEQLDQYINELNTWRQEKAKYLDMALLHGDKQLLLYADDLVPEADITSNPHTLKDNLIESLAYYEFAAMRGRSEVKYLDAPGKIREYTLLHGDYTLTNSDKNAILSKARSIYNDYNQRRIELGLGPFTDSEPEELSVHKILPHTSTALLDKYIEEVGPNAF